MRGKSITFSKDLRRNNFEDEKNFFEIMRTKRFLSDFIDVETHAGLCTDKINIECFAFYSVCECKSMSLHIDKF